MSTATLQKPSARKRTRGPITLAQATDAAMTDLSQAIDLIASARSTADTGHYLERTLRMAEEIALTVMGWLDHGEEDRDTWMDRLYDCQSLLMCAVAYNESPASTLLSQQAAKLLDKITDDLGQQFAGEAPRAAATVEEQPAQAAALSAERRILAFDAYHQITGLADGLQKILNEHGASTGCTDEAQLHLGIVARINLLADVIFHAARLDGTDGSGWGDWDDLVKLRRVFEGRMP